MALIGKMEEYNENDSWIEYTERLEYYFAASEIRDNNKKRAVLLGVCGGKTYKPIRNLVNSRKPTNKSFAELVNLVKNHLNHRPSTIAYRFKFNSLFSSARRNNTTVRRRTEEFIGALRICDQLQKNSSRSSGLRCEKRTRTAEIARRKSTGR